MAACNVVKLKIDDSFAVGVIISLFVNVCLFVSIYLIFLLETITLSTFHLGDVLKEVGDSDSWLKLSCLELTCWYRDISQRKRRKDMNM